MGIGIGLSVTLVVAGIIAVVCIVLMKKRASYRKSKSTGRNLPEDNIELSQALLSLNKPAKPENSRSDEYAEIAGPPGTACRYETMPPEEPDEQEHIYSKI